MKNTIEYKEIEEWSKKDNEKSYYDIHISRVLEKGGIILPKEIMYQSTSKGKPYKPVDEWIEEVFIRHPVYDQLYFSQYGRAIRWKRTGKSDIVHLINDGNDGKSNKYLNLYLYGTNMKKYPGRMHRSVAETWRLFPDFGDNMVFESSEMQVHHQNKNKRDNNIKNLFVVPRDYHKCLEGIKTIEITKLKGGNSFRIGLENFAWMAERYYEIPQIKIYEALKNQKPLMKDGKEWYKLGEGKYIIIFRGKK